MYLRRRSEAPCHRRQRPKAAAKNERALLELQGRLQREVVGKIQASTFKIGAAIAGVGEGNVPRIDAPNASRRPICAMSWLIL
jgi:hypothetical protein